MIYPEYSYYEEDYPLPANLCAPCEITGNRLSAKPTSEPGTPRRKTDVETNS